jgi:hypothetical protein
MHHTIRLWRHLTVGTDPLVDRGVELGVHIRSAADRIPVIALPLHAKVSVTTDQRVVIGRLLICMPHGKLHHAIGESVGALVKTKLRTFAFIAGCLASISLICRAAQHGERKRNHDDTQLFHDWPPKKAIFLGRNVHKCRGMSIMPEDANGPVAGPSSGIIVQSASRSL